MVFILHRFALVYNYVQKSKSMHKLYYLRSLWALAAGIFLIALFYSHFLAFALAVVFFVSSYLESNPF